MDTNTAVTVYQGGEASQPNGSDEIARKRRLFRAFESNKGREQDEMRVARRYYSGRQWTDAEIQKLERRKQPVIWDNRIARKVDFLVGVEQRMRRDPKAYARGPSDQPSADVATASVRFVCDINRWEQMASNGAHDGMVSGVGVVWVGAENGIKGADVKLKLGQVDRFFYDPRSTMSDFSDARYMGMHLWLDIEDVKAEYPQAASELDDMADRTGGLSKLRLEEDRAEQWADFERQRVRIVEMYERKPTPSGGYAWYFCKFTGSVMLEHSWSPYKDENGQPDCPYVAWSPYVDERGDRYGVVRNMRPMQDEVNHRRSKLLHLTNVRQVHMTKGAVEDIDATRDQLSKPDGIIEHNGMEWGKDIGLIDTQVEMKGQAELLAQAQASLENLGPNPGLIGKGGGVADQSGRAILAQRDSGMTELSPVFERLRDWKLRIYRKIWARIRQTWQGERYIRVTENPDAPKFIGINAIVSDPMTGMLQQQNQVGELDVDIVLDEGPDTIVMQEELMQTLAQLGEMATGPLGRVMIELSQVNNKDRLLQIMDKAQAPPPEVAELQNRMQQLELQMREAAVAKVHSEIEKNRADAAQKISQSAIPLPQFANAFPVPFQDMGQDQIGMGQPQPGQMQGGQQPQAPMAPQQQHQFNGGVPQDMPLDQMRGGLPIGQEFAGGISNGVAMQ
jgi:hypothetical protein